MSTAVPPYAGPVRELRITRLRRRMFAQPSVERLAKSPSWLYLMGGACLAAVGALYVAGIGLSIALGPAPSGDVAYLTSLATHPDLARINFIAFGVVDLLLLPGMVGLYASLRDKSRTLMIAAGALMAVNLVIDLGVTEYNSMLLVGFGQQYVAAASASQQASILATAQAARNVLPLATLLSFSLSSVGYLFAAIASFRSVFRKAIGVVGIVGSVEGILAGFYVVIPALSGLLIVCLATVGLWAIFVGIRLVRLSTERHAPASVTTL